MNKSYSKLPAICNNSSKQAIVLRNQQRAITVHNAYAPPTYQQLMLQAWKQLSEDQLRAKPKASRLESIHIDFGLEDIPFRYSHSAFQYPITGPLPKCFCCPPGSLMRQN